MKPAFKLYTPMVRNQTGTRQGKVDGETRFCREAAGRSGLGRGLAHRPYPVAPNRTLRAFQPVRFLQSPGRRAESGCDRHQNHESGARRFWPWAAAPFCRHRRGLPVHSSMKGPSPCQTRAIAHFAINTRHVGHLPNGWSNLDKNLEQTAGATSYLPGDSGASMEQVPQLARD